MENEFFRTLDGLRGTQFVLQDNRTVYSRMENWLRYGYSSEDVIGHPISEIIAPECIEDVLAIFRDRLDGPQRPAFYETALLEKGGGRVPLECAVWSTTYRNRPAVAGVMVELGEERGSTSLRERHQGIRQVLSKGAARAGEGIAVFRIENDDEFPCIHANDEFARMSGYDTKELERLTAWDLFEDGIDCQGTRSPNRSKEKSEPLRSECDMLIKGGGTIPVQVCYGIVESPQFRQAIIIHVRDITERRSWEARNTKLQQDMRFYARQVVKTQEEERKRLSRELHDSTIQTLLVISDQLRDVSRTSDDRFAQLNELVEHAIVDARSFIWRLRPPVLDDMGLAPTLRWLGGNISRADDLKVEICITGQEKRLPANVELSVFRIAQEALNNVHRHAHASTAKVVLDFAEEWITLTISDDGCGFQVPERLASLVGKGKLGVIGMNERSLDIGATLKIESKPGQGTVISIQIPQPGAAQESGKVFEGPPIKPSRTSSKTSNLSQ